MGLMDRGMAVLNARMKTAAGRSVTYTRSGSPSVPITAWLGNTLFARNQSEQGAAVVWGDRDYLFTVADLVAAGFANPEIGDRIGEVIGGELVTFEIQPPDTGDPAWRYSDSTRTRFRLHVKRIENPT